MLPGSEPASGSVTAKAPSISPRASGTRNFRFFSSLPNLRIGSEERFVTDIVTAVEAQAAAIS